MFDKILQVNQRAGTFGGLLRIAQIESGSRRSGFHRVDLSAVFAALADAFSAGAVDIGQSLVVQVEPGITVEGDRELLTQMLANLVENANRHTPEGTRIEIPLRKIGMTVTEQSQTTGRACRTNINVFSGVSTALTKSQPTPGSGRGVILVAAIADLHSIRVEIAPS